MAYIHGADVFVTGGKISVSRVERERCYWGLTAKAAGNEPEAEALIEDDGAWWEERTASTNRRIPSLARR